MSKFDLSKPQKQMNLGCLVNFLEGENNISEKRLLRAQAKLILHLQREVSRLKKSVEELEDKLE